MTPIRDARDEDGPQLIDLIANCYAEYPGCVLNVDDEAPELYSIATYHARKGGRFWVAENDGRINGSVGFVATDDPAAIELKKLYVAKEARRLGLAARLCELVEEEGRRGGAKVVELWSDTRFKEAHRLYARRGYTRGPETRELHDASKSVEYYFRTEIG